MYYIEKNDSEELTYEATRNAFNELKELWKLYIDAHPKFITHCLRKDCGIEDIIYSTLEPCVSKFLYR